MRIFTYISAGLLNIRQRYFSITNEPKHFTFVTRPIFISCYINWMYFFMYHVFWLYKYVVSLLYILHVSFYYCNTLFYCLYTHTHIHTHTHAHAHTYTYVYSSLFHNLNNCYMYILLLIHFVSLLCIPYIVVI